MTPRQPSVEADLLAKLLVVNLYALGATQGQIARIAGKQKLWVNKLLKGLPRKER